MPDGWVAEQQYVSQEKLWGMAGCELKRLGEEQRARQNELWVKRWLG